MASSSKPLRVSDVRERNEKLVLRIVHSAGLSGISQSEVVQATGLKAPTIFRIFSALEEAGYIQALERDSNPQEESARQERKGRRPVSYAVRQEAFYCVGIEFWVERISIGIFDFRGASIYSHTSSLSRTEDADRVSDLIASLVNQAIGDTQVPRDRILGVGIGAPGQVNVGKRLVASYPRIPGMKNYPIAEILESKLGLPVLLHNNCSVIAQSEFRYGGPEVEASMFMLLLRSGVNGAFVDSGRMFLSPRGTTVEMGHISIDYDGPLCVCGARGCLEAFITSMDSENLRRGNWLFEGLDPFSPSADPILTAAAAYISSAIQTASRLFRPSSFLIVAYSDEIAAEIARRTTEKLSRETSSFDETKPLILGRAYNQGLALRGAADLVIDAFLS
ncbi:MAG: transcriptional regulator/sugar kinase [Spirochaetes bacterium]|nr:MAG: transcriptional regulator/sugar kinase [Spirochaetota bacterium]